MSEHTCLDDLASCWQHPRINVIKFRDAPTWVVYGPFSGERKKFPTHAEAITHAQKEATR